MLAAAAIVFLAVRQRSTVAPPAMPPAPTPVASVAAAHGAVTMQIAGGRAAVAAVGQTIAAGSNIRTNGTSRATVTLVDGGELRIDANTVATLVDARTIHLERGGIYLDSRASTPGSVTVRTASGTVRDIGTRFEVRAGDRDLRIRVRDGAVQLERAGRIDRAQKGTELLARADGRCRRGPSIRSLPTGPGRPRRRRRSSWRTPRWSRFSSGPREKADGRSSGPMRSDSAREQLFCMARSTP